MEFKNIHVIINPASGKEEPILSYLDNAFKHVDINLDITVANQENHVFTLAKKLVAKTDIVAIYGGDGSVSDVARALYQTATPMAIIPGGTANVTSKELGIPQETEKAITLLTKTPSKVIDIDMGLINKVPFLLRVNLGIMADMILSANAELKDHFGQLAYGVTAIQSIHRSEPVEYTMLIDGREFTESAVALTITNAGNIGIGDFSFLPGINISDGYLDVISMKDADILSMLKVAGTTLLQTESDILKHWRCKSITISMENTTKYICDDYEKEAKYFDITVIPGALKILVPDN